MKKTIMGELIQAGTGVDGVTTITYRVDPDELRDFELTFYKMTGISVTAVDDAVRGWYMFDNHTFMKIKFDGDWKDQVMKCWERDPWGTFFVRVDDKEVFNAAGHGREKRDEFVSKLDEYRPEGRGELGKAADGCRVLPIAVDGGTLPND
jgi:hypothetical protein